MNPHLQKNLERLERINREAQAAFGNLSVAQLNWKPAPDRWSIAQCLDHLMTTNDEYWPQIQAVAEGTKQATFWEKIPLLPDLVGWALLRATSPDRRRRMQTTQIFEPAHSELSADQVDDFVQHNQDLAALFRQLDGKDLPSIKITTPVSQLLSYRLYDAVEVIVQHEERHLNQAREVKESKEFPVE